MAATEGAGDLCGTLRARGHGAVMNITSAPFKRRTDSLAAKQALKSVTVVGQQEGREKKKELSLLPLPQEFISSCQDSRPE